MTFTAEIRNWRIVPKPYLGFPCVAGNVFGHPSYSDGTKIWTSEIVYIDEVMGIVTTKNSTYKLGEQPA
jgi:hypothetical protein